MDGGGTDEEEWAGCGLEGSNSRGAGEDEQDDAMSGEEPPMMTGKVTRCQSETDK